MKVSIFWRDADLEARKRSRALDYGIDCLRRATWAMQAASSNDADSLRDAVLGDARRRLESMLRELTALT
jgi:hypothetical protein